MEIPSRTIRYQPKKTIDETNIQKGKYSGVPK